MLDVAALRDTDSPLSSSRSSSRPSYHFAVRLSFQKAGETAGACSLLPGAPVQARFVRTRTRTLPSREHVDSKQNRFALCGQRERDHGGSETSRCSGPRVRQPDLEVADD